MNPERWQRVESIFFSASEAPAEERTRVLAEAWGNDAEMRRQIEQLLAADRGAETVAAAVDAVARDFASEHAAPGARPSRLGPYDLIEELGRGGMGTVYRAARCDDQFRKEVAIKLARFGLDSPEFLARFLRERQILATLEHPNIARLIDGGATANGLPYVVMELVDGEPLAEYCRRKKLTVRDKLELFRKICSAVAYAHRNLIVHRDLKPGNILVTAAGEPKLLDFGIAKLLDPEIMQQTVAETATGLRLLTPEYASPEQLRGETITTASDVYSLGVLLYELLTGEHPFRPRTITLNELARRICEWDPTAPSTRATAAADKRSLEGDLDNIVLMALRKEPERRYSSAEQLGDDLRRHMAGYPVAARKDTWSYRSSKFVRRNRIAVGLAAVLLCSLIAFSIGMAVLAGRVTRERDQAERQRKLAERQTQFLVDLFADAAPESTRGRPLSALDLLDKGSEKLQTQLSGEQDVQAALMGSIGRTYVSLGNYDRAAELLEESRARNDRIFGTESLESANSRYDLAKLAYNKGNYDRAEELQKEVLAIRRAALGSEHAGVGDCLYELSIIADAKGEEERGESYGRQALEIHRKTAGARATAVADDLVALAGILRHRGDYDAAEPMLREALDIRRERLGEDHPDVAHSLNHLARVLYQKGDYPAAEPLARQALELRRRLFGPHHAETVASQSNLAGILLGEGRMAEAESLYRLSLASLRQELGGEHPYVAAATYSVAQAVLARKDYRAAIALYRQSLALQRQLLPPGHPDVSRVLMGLGKAQIGLGKTTEAKQSLEEAEAILAKHYDDSFPRLKSVRELLASIER